MAKPWIFVVLGSLLLGACVGHRVPLPKGMDGDTTDIWNTMMLVGDYIDGRFVAVAKEYIPSGANNEYQVMGISINPESFKYYSLSPSKNKLAFLYNGHVCVFDKGKNDINYRYQSMVLPSMDKITWEDDIILLWQNDSVVFKCGSGK